jgi:phosphoserine aminotransferase
MKINFTPGPSQLYFTVEDHLRKAIRSGIGSLSHRSREFDSIFRDATGGLRQLLSIPEGHHIFFTGSATEIWERSIQNLVEAHSFHWINGAFSKRFYEISIQSGKLPAKLEVEPGHGFADQKIPLETELMAVTQNETSTGVALPLEFIHGLKSVNKNSLLVVDAVSSLPYPSLDYTRIDSVFFSVQKGFGLPAGLGVWIVNEDCIAKARSLQSKGMSIGSYHNLPTLLAHGIKNQTPETPNVLAIYLLAKVVQDMLRKGIEKIRKETEYKSAILYQALDEHLHLRAFVQEKEFRSKTVITVDCGKHVELVTHLLEKKGMHPGDGYGEFRKNQLRFANFPTHSKEQYEQLVDTISSLKL